MAKKKKKQLDIAKEFENAVYVPLETRQQIEEERKKQREQQSRLFDGGSGSFKTKVKNTAADVSLQILHGSLGAFENARDLAYKGAADVADFVGFDNWAKKKREFANQDTTGEISNLFEHILAGDLAGEKKDEDIDVYEKIHDKSYLTDWSRDIVNSASDSVTRAAMLAASGVPTIPGAAGKVSSFILSGATVGTGIETRAIREGVDPEIAKKYGFWGGLAEQTSESMFGGIGAAGNKIFGFGTGALDDTIIKNVTKYIANPRIRSVVSGLLRAGGEGSEEWASDFLDAFAQKISGYSDEDLKTLITNPDYQRDFWSGFLSSTLSSGGRMVSSQINGSDYDTGMTKTENQVVENILNERTNGKELSKTEIANERKNIIQDLMDGRLAGSEIDKALGETELDFRKDKYITRTVINENTKFTTTDDDLKIDKKQLNKNANLEDVQNKIKVLEQDFLNANNDVRNTTSSHELFDEMKRMIVATGEQQRLTSNKQMAEDGDLKLLTDKKGEPIRNGRGELQYVKADTGQLVTINGYHTKDGMVLNSDSHKIFETTMGHELGESIKANTPEIYKALRKAAIAVGKADGTYTKETFEAIKSTYGKLGTNTDNYFDEYVNDKIGELFESNSNMFNEIGKKPNVVRNLIDEIKYLIKKFTAGSPEQKRLIETQHNLENILKQSVRELNVNEQNESTEEIAPIKKQYSLAPAAIKNLADITGESYSMLESNLGDNDYSAKNYLTRHTDLVQNYMKENNINVEPVMKQIESKHSQEYQDFVKDNDISVMKLANDEKLLNKYFDIERNEFSDLSETAINSLIDKQRQLFEMAKRDNEVPNVLKRYDREFGYIRDDVQEVVDNVETDNKIRKEVVESPEFQKYLDDLVQPLFHKEAHTVEEVMEEAKYNHGTTDDYSVGAYMTTDGELLDFGDSGYRDDHRTVDAFNLDMNEFMDYGAIRMKPESNGFELAQEPTKEQYSKLYDYIEDYAKNNPDNGDIVVDIDTSKNNYDSQFYNINTPTSKIINDIKEYYKTGQFPKQSNLAQFRYSLSVQEANTGKDNEGRTLSKGTQDYFKDSKATDEKGNLITVYHTTSGTDLVMNKSSFYEFNPVGTPGYRYGNQVVNFFTDSQDMSGSYVDQNYTQADTSKIESLEQAQGVVDYYNSSGLIDYEIRDNNGSYELYDVENDEVIHTFRSQDDLFRNIKNEVIEQSGLDEDVNYDGYQYEGYLNLTNPYIVENERPTNWDSVGKDYGQDLKDFYKSLTKAEKKSIKDAMGWEDWGVFKDEISKYYRRKYVDGKDVSEMTYFSDGSEIDYGNTMAELGKKLHDLYTPDAPEGSLNLKAMSDMYDIASDNFKTSSINKFAYRELTTNDIVKQVLEMNENGSNYDGVIFKQIYDYGGDFEGKKTPNNVYVTFNSNQFKSFDNQKPTIDPDIRYSLSPSGEMQDSDGNKVTLETSDTGTTGTLMALHNLGEEKFNGILDLDGIPVPSIAVTNPEIVNHSSFGDGTLIFDKETINPANRYNEVYDRDVWTPTMGDNAQIDYNIEPEKLWALEKNMYRNHDEISSPILNEYFDSDNLRAKVDNYGIEGTIDQAKNSKELKYIYYKTKNPDFEIMKKTKSDDLSTRYSNEMLQDFAKKYNKEIPNWTKISDNQRKEIVNEFENYWKPILEERRDEIIKEENAKPEPKKFIIGMAEASVENNLEWLDSIGGQDKLIEHLHTIQENGGTREVNDVNGTLDFVDNNINQEEFNKWVDSTLGDVLRNAEKGIYNGKEIITENGRRTFKQTHYPYNLKNLVKVLTQGDTKGTQNSMNGFGKIQAKMGNQFSSIDEIRQAQNQLTTPDVANEYIQDIENAIKEDVSDLSDRLDGDFFNWDNANVLIQDFASQSNRNEESFRRLLKDYANKGVSSELIERITNDLEQLKTIPTDYFEAKPQRAVGLDEIQMAVIPNNWSEETKQKLQEKGIKYTEYDPNVEGDRQRVINQFDELKWSLSNPDDIAPFGEGIKSEQIKPRDIQQTVQESVQEAIAPIREQIQQIADEVIKSENLDDLELNLEPFMDMINGDNGQVLSNINQNYDQIMTNLQEQGLPKDAAQNFLQNMVYKYDQAFNKVKQKMSEKDVTKIQKMILDAQEKFTNRNAYIDKLAKDSGNEMIKYKGDLANNSFGQAQYNVQTAQTNLNGEVIGKGVNEIFSQAKKQKLDAAFEDYLFNKSNIERHAVGKGSQVPSAVSEQLVRDYESSFPQFKNWSKDIETYYDNLLNLEIESGLIDQDTYNLLRGENGLYRSYVPFYPSDAEKRYFDDAGDLKPIKTLKRAEGGANRSKIMGIQDAMTKQTMAVWNSMRTNQLYQEIINTLGGEEGLGFIVRNDPSNLSQSLYTDQDGNKFLTAYVNGQEMSTKISDELYNELSKKSENAIKEFEDKYSLLTKPLQGLSKFRRNVLTSWNPTFALFKNPVKDIQDAVLYSKHTAQMLKELPSSYGQLLTNKTKEAQQFRALYGGGEFTGFGKGYARISDMIELAPRFAEFKASLKVGESVEQALYNARDITTNFGRGGYVTKAMNRNGFTFLNASVQGFSKFYRNFAEQPNAGKFAMAVGKAAMLGVVPAIFNELAFGGGDDKDEDYEALPDYIKDNYYLFKTGDGEFIRIPKGRALSVMGSAARRTLEKIEGEEDAFDGYLKNAWSQIGPVEIGSNPLDNTIVAPIAQVLGGEKGSGGNTAGRAWYGGDIVPYRLQGEKPEDQYDASVDKLSIWLGQKTGWSPYKINYVIDQYSGGLGDVILPMLTEETKSGAETVGEHIIAPVKDQVVVNSIDDNKYASEFYSTKEKLYTGSKATDKDLLKAQYMNDVSFDLSALYKEKRAIQSDSSLGKKEKYEKVQQVQKQINEIAKNGLELSDKITVQGNYADVGEDRGYYKNTKGKWTAISQDDMVTIESLGLSDSEKSAYFDVKNQIYNLDNDYKTKKEGKSESEQIQLGIQQKKDRIETIKSSTLPDSAKYAVFDTKYDDKLLPYYEDLGFNANDVLDYKQQTFTADKDKKGKSITNSRKKKVVNYINDMNIPYEQKLILYKKEYKSDKSYDNAIFNYINNSNLDYTSKTKILDELGIKYR